MRSYSVGIIMAPSIGFTYYSVNSNIISRPDTPKGYTVLILSNIINGDDDEVPV